MTGDKLWGQKGPVGNLDRGEATPEVWKGDANGTKGKGSFLDRGEAKSGAVETTGQRPA